MSLSTSSTQTITAFPAAIQWVNVLDATNKRMDIVLTVTNANNVRWLFILDYYEIGI